MHGGKNHSRLHVGEGLRGAPQKRVLSRPHERGRAQHPGARVGGLPLGRTPWGMHRGAQQRSPAWTVVQGPRIWRRGGLSVVPGWYHGAARPVPAWYQAGTNLVPGTRLVPGTWYLVPGTKYLVPGTWYQIPGTLCRLKNARFWTKSRNCIRFMSYGSV